jgi:hypothetical protein
MTTTTTKIRSHANPRLVLFGISTRGKGMQELVSAGSTCARHG